jgi:hypothetical protein
MNACYLCDSVALVMYRCSNAPCGRVFCHGCGTGWDHHTCPACGNHASQGAGLVQAFVDTLTPRPKPESSPQRSETFRGDDKDDRRRSGRRVKSRRPSKLESAVDRLAEQLERKGPPCPNCGGDLPPDSRAKAYRVCMHCRRDLFWAGGMPFASQADATVCERELQQEQDAEEQLIEIERAEMEAEEREESERPRRRKKKPQQVVSVGVAIHFAAVIASVDGKISPAELNEVAATLARSGLSEEQVKERFVTICKRVHNEGLDNWAERLCAMISDSEQQKQENGLTADELLTLLHKLMTVGGGETMKKQRLFSRFTSALRA